MEMSDENREKTEDAEDTEGHRLRHKMWKDEEGAQPTQDEDAEAHSLHRRKVEKIEDNRLKHK